MSLRFGPILVVLALVGCSGEAPALHAPGASAATPPTTTIAQSEAPAARDVTFTTSDGVTISATLARASRVDAPAVILVHQISSTRAEWAPLVERLHVDASITTLAIDMRGHGQSTHGAHGTLDWQTFDDAAWASARLDVLAAVAYLAGPESGVAPAAFAAVGSSMGSTAVIAAAAEEPRLTTLVTVSPGRAYHGVDAITPATTLTSRAIFAVASQDEQDSAETAGTFGRLTSVPALIVPGDAHGVLIFGGDPSALDQVEDFLRERLAWVRLTPRQAAIARPPLTSTGAPPT